MNIVNSHLVKKKLELLWKKWLGEKIYNLVLRRDMECFETTYLYFFSNKMAIYLSVLGLLMKHKLATIWRVASLSHYKIVGCLCSIPKSRSRDNNHTSSQVTFAIALFLASTDDRDIVFFF